MRRAYRAKRRPPLVERRGRALPLDDTAAERALSQEGYHLWRLERRRAAAEHRHAVMAAHRAKRAAREGAN